MNKNLTVGDLKEIIGMLDDDLPVIIPVIDEDNSNCINGFRYVRTAGILEDKGEKDNTVLCLNTTDGENDIRTQITNRGGDVVCLEVLR